MKSFLFLSVIALATSCGEDDPLHPIRHVPKPSPSVETIISEPPATVTAPARRECESDDDCADEDHRCTDAGACVCISGHDCSPHAGEGEGEGEGEGNIQLLLTIRNPPGDQDVAPGDIKVGLFGFDAENLSDQEIGPLHFIGRLFAWFDPADPDSTHVAALMLIERCEL